MSLVRGFPFKILQKGIPSIFEEVEGFSIHSIFEYPVPPAALNLEDGPPANLDRVLAPTIAFADGIPVINRFTIRSAKSKTEFLAFDHAELTSYWSPSLIVTALEMRHWPAPLGLRFATAPEAICLLLCNPWLFEVQFKCDIFHGHFAEARLYDNTIVVVPTEAMTLRRCTFAVSGKNDEALSSLSAEWIS